MDIDGFAVSCSYLRVFFFFFLVIRTCMKFVTFILFFRLFCPLIHTK